MLTIYETKKWLKMRIPDCMYSSAALLYIEVLENEIGSRIADNAQLENRIKQLEEKVALYDECVADAELLMRERDAAVKDMTELMHLGKFCRHCKHITDDGECTHDFDDTNGLPQNCWQWRGV